MGEEEEEEDIAGTAPPPRHQKGHAVPVWEGDDEPTGAQAVKAYARMYLDRIRKYIAHKWSAIDIADVGLTAFVGGMMARFGSRLADAVVGFRGKKPSKKRRNHKRKRRR